MYADRFCWMIRCKCVIYQGGELRLGLLGPRGADSENNTKSKKHFQAQKSKRYDQRYDQDKPGGGNGYIVSNTYAKTRDSSKKPDVQEVDVGR